MSLEDDVSRFEKKVNAFSIAGAAGNFQDGFTIGGNSRGSGAGVRQSISGSPEQRLTKLEKMFHGLKIMGGEDVIVHGSSERGFVVEKRPTTTDSGAGGGGPGPTPTGACCMSDNSCNVLTADDCATMGGTYQGDDVPCEEGTCAVACPDITLVCDQVSGTACGYLAFDDSPHVFLVRTENYTGSYSCSGSEEWCPCLDGCSTVYDRNDVYTLSLDESGNCIGGDCLGSGTCDTSCTPSGETCSGDYDCNGQDCLSCGFVDDQGVCDLDGWFSNSCGAPDLTETTLNCNAESRGGNASQTFTLSDENTGFVSSYDNDFNDTCEASFSSSTVGSVPYRTGTFTITRFKPKFTFSSSMLNFTLTYNEHFVPIVGSPSDTLRSLDVFVSDTEIIGPEVFEPSEDGTITITDILCTPV